MKSDFDYSTISFSVLLFPKRLTDNFIQNWHSRLDFSNRALFYRSIVVFQFQPYLEKINIRKFSQAFSRLRMSSRRLEIESGRWARPNSIPFEDRKCILCEVLEDEFHFVIECTMPLDLTKRYIPSYFWKRPSMFKSIELINSSNETLIRKLSTFIWNIIILVHVSS